MTRVKSKSTYDGNDEQFEITDYTQASPWETLISELEDLIQKLLVEGKSTDNQINYNSKSYQLVYITPNEPVPEGTQKQIRKKKKSSLIQLKYNNFTNAKNDFQFNKTVSQNDKKSIGYQLENFSNWFGIHEYFLLLSLRDTGPNLSDLSILMSAFTIALHNSHCFLPAFVGFDEKRYENFLGYMFAPIDKDSVNSGYFSVKLATELISQSSLTSNQNVSESIEKQLKIFYSKISLDPDDRNWDQFLSLSTTSTKYTYTKGHWDENSWRLSILPTIDNNVNSNNNNQKQQQQQHEVDSGLNIRWGFPIDPVQELQLCVMCPPLKTTHILDGNDFSSMPTPKTWFIKSSFRRTHSSMNQLTLATQSLFNYFIESFKSAPLQEIVSYYRTNSKEGGKQQFQQQQQQESNDPSLIKTMGTFGKSIASSLVSPSIPSERDIDLILRDLFYDEKDQSDIYHFNNIPEEDLNSPPPIGDKQQSTNIKRAPLDSLFFSFCTVCLSIQSLAGIIMVWNDFIHEIKWHWENLKVIPKTFSSAQMNANNCLIFQKLQMINYCIKLKLEFQQQQEKYKIYKLNNNINSSNSSSKKNEDLLEHDEEGNGWDNDVDFEVPIIGSPNESDSTSFNNGTLKDKYLLYEDREIVIPLTQDSGPMTDDMVTEHLNQLMELTGEDQSEKRLELQTPSLLSDMQAFKNANPGCVFEDFIRWHSTGDWITNPNEIQKIIDKKSQSSKKNKKVSSNSEDDTMDVDDSSENGDDDFILNEDDESNGRVLKQGFGREGCLSMRMSSNNTIWKRVWKSAQPVHIYDQSPLFDFNKQSESAIDYLLNIPPNDLMYQIISVILISIASVFSNEKSKSNLSIEYCLGVDFLPLKQTMEQYYESVNTKWFNILPTDKITVTQFNNIFQTLQDIEINYSKYTSLKTKFGKLDRVISNLYLSGYSDILENEFNIVADLFFGDREDYYSDSTDIEYDITNSFQPNVKEYITRSYLPRPFKHSQILPHKMYTSISPFECRVATCISEEDV
ncbi:hypothetical protein DLAC_06966 [Tieghemostelium lacteum]|uniref:Rab3 GTPase-activating protein catalytic subunit n=1 Tax=Tieghemostelium lacteum TaxID=361077 RepID=A0A151ZDW7_TIELA|nr:hypothetical protein DLAC_06966 [Tieghemostelium lacteum]|eukprot:KYQ92125.1 hypothetical protein DLAC_06966 [Tieghemostelium lacteum]